MVPLFSFFESPLVTKFSFLSALLTPEQLSSLRTVQAGLERDPTCLDRAPTETVPNCYTEEASPPTLTNNEETNNA